MNEPLEKIKFLIKNLPNVNESLNFLITELEETQKAFDELDSLYVDLQEQNKELLEGLATIGNAIHEGEISGRGTDEDLILEIVDKHWRMRNE